MTAEVIKLSGAAVITLCAVTVLKGYRPELALQVGIAAGVVILSFGMNAISGTVQAAKALMSGYGIDPEGMMAVGKMIGIAYIAQFSADTCRDCGESSLAGKVELVGRLMMVAAAIPLIISTMEEIGGLMGQ